MSAFLFFAELMASYNTEPGSEPSAPITISTFAQARQFKECTDITGVILTKMDGSAKGGIAIAIQSELGIPVKYIGVGEQIDDLQKFDSHQFVEALFEENGEDITSNIELGE